MKALILYAHPEPTSFTAALKDQARATLVAAGWEAVVSDLYGEQFAATAGRDDFVTCADPDRFHYQGEQSLAFRQKGFAPDLIREQQRLADADLLILLFPLWWGGVPAVVKGWIDRVLAYGFAYSDGARFDQGYFQGRHALIGLSTGGTAQRFSHGGTYGEIEQLLYPLQQCVLRYMGFTTHAPFAAYGVPRTGPEDRTRYLADWSARLAQVMDQVQAAGPVDRTADLRQRQQAQAGNTGWTRAV